MAGELVDARERGWFHVDNAVIDAWGAAIGVYGVAVYALLVRKSDRGGESFPSFNWIAEHLGMSRRQAVDTVRLLEQHGLIRVRTIKPEGRRPHNVYTLVTIGAPHAPVQEVPRNGAPHAPEMVHHMHPIKTQSEDPSIKTHNNAQCVRENLPRARAHEATFSPMHPDLPPDQLAADAAACGTTPAIYRGQIAQWADKRRAQGTTRADWRADLRSFVRASLEIGAVRASPARASPAGARPVTFAEQRDRNTDAAIDEVRALIEGGNGNGSRAVSGRDEAGRCRLSGGPDDPDPRGVLGAVARGGGRGVPRGGVAGD